MHKLDLLEELLVDGNELTSLPLSIGFCSSLKSLSARNNKIVTIPYSLEYLSSIEYLNLANNLLQVFPSYLFEELSTYISYEVLIFLVYKF